VVALRIYMLGPFRVEKGGLSLSDREWRSKQNRLILKLLLVKRGQVVLTDELEELLWPGEDPETARSHLHVRISQLRRLLDPGDPAAFIRTVEGGYAFDLHAQVWIDVTELETLTKTAAALQEQGNLTEAIPYYESARTLYEGDFLAEDLYADWTYFERERLREVHLWALTELAECYARLGRYRRAIDLCQQILGVDACREAVYQRLMLYSYYAGETAQSLRAYERCRQVLSQELEVEPLPATTALVEQIRAGILWAVDGAPRYPPPVYDGRLYEIPYSLGRTPFVGRQREYSWLIDRWQNVQRGVILLEGEAGVGKTRLAEEFLGYAGQHEAVVLRAYLGGEPTPYAAWLTALNSNADGAEDLAKALGFTRAGQFAAHLSHRGPFINSKLDPDIPKRGARLPEVISTILQDRFADVALIFVDDAQRLDPASLDLLPHLAEHALILLTCRSEETPPTHPLRKALASLHRSRIALAQLALEPISQQHTVEMIQQLGGNDLPALSERLYALTEGNPFYLIASLQHLFEQGALYVDPRGGWIQTADQSYSLPPTIAATIEMRLSRLELEQRRILDLAAVIGVDFDFELLQSATGMAESTLIEGLDRLMTAALIIEPRLSGRGEFTISHSYYSEVVYSRLPAVRRRQLHRQTAIALERLRGEDPAISAVLARHYHLGNMIEEAIRHTICAGQYALGLYAAVQAESHFAQAWSWIEEAGMELTAGLRAELHLGWAESLRLTGRYRQAIDHYSLGLPDAEGDLKQAAAFQICLLDAMQGAGLEGFDRLIAQLETELDLDGDSWPLAMLRWSQGLVAFLRGEVKSARDSNAAGWRIARRLRDCGQTPPTWLVGRALTGLSRPHEFWGSWQRTRRYSARLLALSESNGDKNGEAVAHAGLGAACFWRGDWPAASEHYLRCLELASKASDPRLQCEALYHLGEIALESGDEAETERFITQICQISAVSGGMLHQALGQVLAARQALAKGQPERAIQILAPLAQLASVMSTRLFKPIIDLALVEAHWQAGHIQTAWEIAGLTAEQAGQFGLRREQGVALRIQGEAALALGMFAEAQLCLDEAARVAEKLGCPLDLGRARCSLARLEATS
jgi:DNA-binding SARP family transcriptional activator